MLWFTYVVRPGEAPEGRGPRLEPFWGFLVSFNLRLGIFLQCCAFVGMTGCMMMAGKAPLALLAFLNAEPELMGAAPVPLIQICCGLFLLGNLLTMAFQSLTDDDGSIKQSRGYRAGTKLLQQASSIAVFGWTLTLLSFWAANNYFDEPWMTKQIGASSTWLIFFTARVCDATSLAIYGWSLLFLEGYHSEGVGQLWGWACGLLFQTACCFEIAGLAMYETALFPLLDYGYTIAYAGALLVTLLWVAAFEPISHRYDVKLTQSAMRNEYYKSRNAMAYYGPAVVNAQGEMDIAAAAEQVQACLNYQ